MAVSWPLVRLALTLDACALVVLWSPREDATQRPGDTLNQSRSLVSRWAP